MSAAVICIYPARADIIEAIRKVGVSAVLPGAAKLGDAGAIAYLEGLTEEEWHDCEDCRRRRGPT